MSFSWEWKNVQQVPNANFQASTEIIEGFPILRRYISEVNNSKGLLKSLEILTQANPRETELKVAFSRHVRMRFILYLSYKDQSYVVR